MVKVKNRSMPLYTNDMMHCTQHQCKKRNQCYRYWLGKHARGIVTVFHPQEPVTDGCEHFNDIKDW